MKQREIRELQPQLNYNILSNHKESRNDNFYEKKRRKYFRNDTLESQLLSPTLANYV